MDLWICLRESALQPKDSALQLEWKRAHACTQTHMVHGFSIAVSCRIIEFPIRNVDDDDYNIDIARKREQRFLQNYITSTIGDVVGIGRSNRLACSSKKR